MPGVPRPRKRQPREKLVEAARRMRQEPTSAEDVLWERLRNRQIADLNFRRQHTIDRFVADFYCAEARLVIEVDGPIHESTRGQDAERQAMLESLRLRVIRFTNEEALNHPDQVLEQIRAALEE